MYDGPVGDAVRRAFGECEQLVCFLATGAVVRLVAPLLAGKTADPGVVCVDEAGRHAVALLGGHGGGANELARAVGGVLGAEPVVTTATDAAGLPGLDTLGLPVEGDVAGVTRALLDGEPVVLDAEVPWPLPALPFADGAGDTGGAVEGAYRVRVTDREVPAGEREVLLRPASLVVGGGRVTRGAGRGGAGPGRGRAAGGGPVGAVGGGAGHGGRQGGRAGSGGGGRAAGRTAGDVLGGRVGGRGGAEPVAGAPRRGRHTVGRGGGGAGPWR
ncbi:hypothetical protein GCM10020256_60490 [Streptomyces thermocoprophilus]